MNFMQAWKKGPGPESTRDYLVLILKGICMGVADIIPGVSGGTMAFITGIYDNLIDSIRSFNGKFIKSLLRLNFYGAVAEAHLKFLLPLLLGIVVAMVSMARVIHSLLGTHPVQVWSLFFGLIAASILVVGRRVGDFSFRNLFFGIVGAVFSFFLVGLIPVTTPDTLWFVFICASISICAMILPGISGAFILLLLGKYEFITGAIRNPTNLENGAILLAFVCGCAFGISLFSRVLHFLLEKHHAITVSLLTGFMAGAMRKIWPWKEVLDSVVIRGKVHVLSEANVLPPAFNGEFAGAVLLMVAGFAAVIILEWVSSAKDS
ncbi:DUF368 domain-containing protein [Maridesulfovibrio sp.]|uniref:DUF368 domain-containing protein n=1 Tax=Maridesulfovibrio sp. TaxID=2795000 RepID=UPI0029CA5D18|nr:DUF368 domain-containing protein [Maridesulfovibrio sp.]